MTALAISGGVDSMALAGLCAEACKAQASTTDSQIKLSFTPLIVDHRLRPQSTNEAELVSKRVEKLLGTMSPLRYRIPSPDLMQE